MYTARVRYGELLLALLRREVSRARVMGTVDRPRFDALCDRFERLLPTLHIAPLVWEGDNA